MQPETKPLRLAQLTAKLSKFSSVVGQSVQLIDHSGRPYAMLAIINMQSPNSYKDMADAIGEDLVTLINENCK